MDKDKTKNTETSNPKTITAIKQIKLHKKLKQNLAQPHYMSPIKNKIALSKLKTKQVNSSKEIPSSSPQLLRSITPNMKRNRDVINCNNTKKVMNTTNSNYKSRSLTPIRGVSNPNGKTNNGMNVDNGMSGLKNNHKELAIILALKKKIRAMSEMMEKKDKEIAKLKVGQSKARINELEIENKVLNNEMKKMKEIFEKKGMSDYKEISEQVQKDKEEIKQLQEHLKIIGEKYQNEMIKSKKSEESYLNLNQDYTALKEENEKIKKENEQLKEKSQKENEYDKEYTSLQEEKVKELTEQIDKLNSLLEQVTKEKEDLISQHKETIEKLQKEKEEANVNGNNNEEIEKITKEKEELEAISKSDKEMIDQLNKEKENLIEVSNTDKQIISSYQHNFTTLLSIPLLDDLYINAISITLQHQHKTLNIDVESIKEITQKDKELKSITESLCDIYHIDKNSLLYLERYLITLIKTTDNISIESLSDKLIAVVTEEKQSSSDIPDEINENIKTLFDHLTFIDVQFTKEISIDILYSFISSLYSDNKEIAFTSILNYILSNSNLPQLPLLSYNYQCLSELIKTEDTVAFIPRNDTNLVITDAKEPHLLVEESEKKSTILNGIEEQEKTSQHEEPPITFTEMLKILKSHIESTKTSIESILSVFTDEDFIINDNNVKLLPISTYQSKMTLLSGHVITSVSFDEKVLEDTKDKINIPLFISLFNVNDNELISVNQATKEYVDEVFNEVVTLNKNKQ